jgi:hypothetical protein
MLLTYENNIALVESYLDRILDRGGKLCAHKQLSRSVNRTIKETCGKRVRHSFLYYLLGGSNI